MKVLPMIAAALLASFDATGADEPTFPEVASFAPTHVGRLSETSPMLVGVILRTDGLPSSALLLHDNQPYCYGWFRDLTDKASSLGAFCCYRVSACGKLRATQLHWTDGRRILSITFEFRDPHEILTFDLKPSF